MQTLVPLVLLFSAVQAQFGADQSNEEAPISQSFKALLEVCGSSDILPEKCTCAGGKSFPVDIEDIGECKPIKCICPENTEEITVTVFGCINGGAPE